jgi:hypothetical protein
MTPANFVIFKSPYPSARAPREPRYSSLSGLCARCRSQPRDLCNGSAEHLNLDLWQLGLLVFCFTVTLAGFADAQIIAKGIGAGSCAEYAQFYRADPHGSDSIFLTWAQGYLSGINEAAPDSYLDLGAKTPDDMARFLRRYCEAHPLANYMDGASELSHSLPTIRKK